ncbi:hypothetical protein MASR2M69_06940 [Bacteroidota bacterium]
MKKFFALFLVAGFVLVSCGNKKTEEVVEVKADSTTVAADTTKACCDSTKAVADTTKAVEVK